MTRFLAVLLLFPFLAFAVELPEEIRLMKDGSFRVGNAAFFIQCFDENWRHIKQSQWEVDSFRNRELAARLPLGGGIIRESWRPLTEKSFQLDFNLRFPSPVRLNSVNGAIDLAAETAQLEIDGNLFELKRQQGKVELLPRRPFKQLKIGLDNGRALLVAGEELEVMVQDNWRFHSTAFQIRLYSKPWAGEINSTRLQLEFRLAEGTIESAPTILREDDSWRRLDFSRAAVPGGVLDFSGLLDAPAGKYGFVRCAPDGTFRFENAPGQRIRFFGTNLVYSANYPAKEAAVKLAEYLAYCGYNAVRFHHYDRYLVDHRGANSLAIRPEQLEKLDFLFAELKKRGIYITLDLYTARRFRPGDHIPELDPVTADDGQWMKPLLPFSAAAMANWKEFTRRLMSHRNPHTGLRWGEDPAIFCINLVNEDNLSSAWKLGPYRELHLQKYEEFRRANRLPKEAVDEKNRHFRKFLHELQGNVHAEQLRFVREELGLKTLLTSLNKESDLPLTLLRARFDLTDNHQYWSHPRFPGKPWQLPFAYEHTSAIASGAELPAKMMPTRIFGKPFIVTEFNYCFPNRFRAEAGPLTGAYASLQNWDGLFRYSWNHEAENIREMRRIDRGFDAANDPLAQFSDRIAILLFLRGDVQAARNKTALVVPAGFFASGLPFAFPQAFRERGLYEQIGSLPEGVSIPGVRLLAYREAEKPARHPAPEQLRLDPERPALTIATPRAESLTLGAGELTATHFRLKDADTFMTASLFALDGREIRESGSLLLIHLTDVANSEERFRDSGMSFLEDYGKLPLLVRRGSASAELAVKHPLKVTALNADGKALGEVESHYNDGVVSFRLDSTAFPGGVMAYHLTERN